MAGEDRYNGYHRLDEKTILWPVNQLISAIISIAAASTKQIGDATQTFFFTVDLLQHSRASCAWQGLRPP